jgi:hypothetical protein
MYHKRMNSIIREFQTQIEYMKFKRDLEEILNFLITVLTIVLLFGIIIGTFLMLYREFNNYRLSKRLDIIELKLCIKPKGSMSSRIDLIEQRLGLNE